MLKQRLISLLLLLTLAASSASLLFCSGDTESPADTAPETAATVTEVPDSLEARMNVKNFTPFSKNLERLLVSFERYTSNP